MENDTEQKSDFSGAGKVRDLALAEEGNGLPFEKETVELPLKYAEKPDYIAVLEMEILKLQQEAEPLEFDKIWLENFNMTKIQKLAADDPKGSGLTNEQSRNTAYQKACIEDQRLQEVLSKLRENKWAQKKLQIEVENQERAFQLKVHGVD